MNRHDIETTIKNAVEAAGKASGDSPVYWNVCDGHCSGTELVWLPRAERWVYRDNDGHRVGDTDELTLILSGADGDESGLHRLPDLIAIELVGNIGLWVLAGELPEDFELPEDVEVYTLREPARGIVAVEIEA